MSEENLQPQEEQVIETAPVVEETPAPVVEEAPVVVEEVKEETKAKKSAKKEEPVVTVAEPVAEEVVVVVEATTQCAPETVQRPGRHEMYAVAPVEFGVRRKL